MGFWYDRVYIPLCFAGSAFFLGLHGWNWIDGTFFIMLLVGTIGLAIIDYMQGKVQ